jgi:hypothetical protein
MGIAQMSALSGGKRYKRPYVDEINARKGALPGLYAQKKDTAYQDKMFGLENQKLAQNEKFGLANLDLMQDAQNEAKKRNKTAKQLGYANIGLGAALGAADNWDAISGGVSGVKSMFPQVGSPSSLGIGTPESYGGRTVSGMSSDWLGGNLSSGVDWLSENVLDPFGGGIKKLGSGIWDAGKGIYDSLVGDTIDIDWSGGFDDVIDFGW